MSANRSAPRTYAVALINPPSAPGTVANREGAAGMGTVYPDNQAFLYPPQTLAMVAASLRNAGYEVQAFDAVVEELPDDAFRVEVAGIFVSYASLEADLAFIETLREQTSARLVAFGPAMRFVSERVLARAAVDAVLIGEAEGFIAAALQYLDGECAWLPRRAWTPADVRATCCDAQGFVQDLAKLPFPAWDLLPYEKYALLTVLSTRGCPDRCAYCPYAVAQGHRFRTRSVENVLAELAWLSERFRPSRLVFRDPVFAHDRERVISLCEGILRRGLRLRWECESRPEHFDADLLRLMQRAGCQWIKVGLETADEALLQSLRRVNSAEEAVAYLQHVAHVVNVCAKIGLNCRLFVMAGLPGENATSAQQTRRFLEILHPSALNVRAFEAYPGIALEAVTESDCAAQIEVLHQAQATIEGRLSHSPGLLARGKRWMKGFLHRGKA